VDAIRTEGLDHVALTVSELGRSRDFYANVLGLEQAYEEWHEPVFMLGSGSGLALFTRESHPVDGAGDGEREIRLLHIAFRVGREEFDRARAELPKLAIEVHFSDHGICHSIYFADPDGHQLELTTYEL